MPLINLLSVPAERNYVPRFIEVNWQIEFNVWCVELLGIGKKNTMT